MYCTSLSIRRAEYLRVLTEDDVTDGNAMGLVKFTAFILGCGNAPYTLKVQWRTLRRIEHFNFKSVATIPKAI